MLLLISLTISGCSFFAEKFDRLRGGTASADSADASNMHTSDGSDDQMESATLSSAAAPASDAAAAPMIDTLPSMLAIDIDDKELVKQIQAKLNLLGFDAGTADGVAGPKTLMALARFRDMAGVLGNPDLGDMLQEVVAANELGVDKDKPWWQRRLPDGTADDTERTAGTDLTSPAVEQDVTTRSEIVATAEALRAEEAIETSNLTDSAETQIPQTEPQASLETDTTALTIPPSVSVSSRTAEPTSEQLRSDTNIKDLNEEAHAVNKRLVGNGIAGARSANQLTDDQLSDNQPIDGERINTAAIDPALVGTSTSDSLAPASVESIDLSALAPPAIGVSSSSEPERQTFVSRVRGAWSSTKRKVRSTFNRTESSTVETTEEATPQPINPDTN